MRDFMAFPPTDFFVFGLRAAVNSRCDRASSACYLTGFLKVQLRLPIFPARPPSRLDEDAIFCCGHKKRRRFPAMPRCVSSFRELAFGAPAPGDAAIRNTITGCFRGGASCLRKLRSPL